MRRLLFLIACVSFSSRLMAAQISPPQTPGKADTQAESAVQKQADDEVIWDDDSSASRSSDEQAEGAHDATADAALLQGARFTLTQELATQIKEPYGIENNRTSFRMEYGKHFLDNFFVHFDAIETGFWGQDHRAQAIESNFFTESTIRDAYLQFSKADSSVKIGRQILIWGESDVGAITDVISPRDLRELYFISLEKARISQFMLTVDQFSPIGDWQFFYIPKKQFNEYAGPGDVYFYDPFSVDAEMTTIDKSLREYGLRWKKTFGNSDISVMAAHMIDNDYAIHQSGVTSTGTPVIVKEPQPFNMLGFTTNYVAGGFLFACEAAMKSPLPFLDPASMQVMDKDEVDTSLRMEYNLGNAGNRSVSLEAVNNHVVGWNSEVLPVARNTNTLVLGLNDSFFNQNLSVSWLTVYNKTYTGFTHSLYTNYKLNSSMSLDVDAFYMNVKDSNNILFPYNGKNSAVFRIIYQF